MHERLAASRALVVLVASLAFSCTRPNPLFHPNDGGAGAGGPGTGGNAGGGGGGGGKGGSGGADAGTDGSGGPCSTGDVKTCYTPTSGINVGVCHAGVSYCIDGVWQACIDQVTPAAAETCNLLDDDCNQSTDDGFPATTCGLGACAKTLTECQGGAIATCVPGTPAATETCGDNIDNNCNGAVDEGCPSSCVRVSSLSGNDNTPDGTVMPFATIQAAIDWAAAANGNGRPKRVCVAGGADCATPVTYQLAAGATITMRDGISVYGNYESTGWTRCPVGAGASVTVTIAPGASTGVVFPLGVASPTTLDGVRITRLDQGPTTAGVTIDAAKQAILSNLFVDDAPSAATSTYGVDLKNGATATIMQSLILGGGGAMAAVGVHSNGATPVVRDNCSSINQTTGNCAADCTQPLGIRGRSAGSGTVASSSAVQLQDSAGAIVDRNTLCGGAALQGDALRIAGMSKGIAVRGNTIIATGATVEAHAIRLDSCGGAGPWIAGNELIQADAATATANLSAIGAAGGCHPVIERNAKIVALGEAGMGPAAGVACGADSAGDVSLCVVAGNTIIQGSAGMHPSTATGILCRSGACQSISDNKSVSGVGGGDVVGLSLAGGGTRVERNMITGGCGRNSAVGIRADDTHAFIVNNVVLGSSCPGSVTTPLAIGLQMRVATANGNEAEVHSNTIDAGGLSACQGAAATVNAAVAPSTTAIRRGIFRNNILRGGACETAFDFREETAGVSPRLLENNDFDPVPLPTGLYFNNSLLIPGGQGQTVTSLAGVNGLMSASKGKNISEDPMFVMYPTNLHLVTGSKCIDAGTVNDAPSTDFDNKMRVGTPDIGAYEKTP
jgi:hypothetical protein